jgi:hypothetical protein
MRSRTARIADRQAWIRPELTGQQGSAAADGRDDHERQRPHARVMPDRWLQDRLDSSRLHVMSRGLAQRCAMSRVDQTEAGRRTAPRAQSIGRLGSLVGRTAATFGMDLAV